MTSVPVETGDATGYRRRSMVRGLLAPGMLPVVIGIAVYTIPFVAEFCGFTPLTSSQFGETLGLGLVANTLITLVALVVDRRNRAATATVDTERYTWE